MKFYPTEKGDGKSFSHAECGGAQTVFLTRDFPIL